jgi:hypothetical protein
VDARVPPAVRSTFCSLSLPGESLSLPNPTPLPEGRARRQSPPTAPLQRSLSIFETQEPKRLNVASVRCRGSGIPHERISQCTKSLSLSKERQDVVPSEAEEPHSTALRRSPPDDFINHHDDLRSSTASERRGRHHPSVPGAGPNSARILPRDRRFPKLPSGAAAPAAPPRRRTRKRHLTAVPVRKTPEPHRVTTSGCSHQY